MDARSFVDFLIRERVGPADRKKAIIEATSISGDRVDTAVLDLALTGEATMLSALGQFTKSRTVQPSDIASASPELTSLIPTRLARRFGVIPFRRDGKTLSVAALDPGDLLVQDELALLTGSMITTFAALEIHIREGLARHYGVALAPRVEALLRRFKSPGKRSQVGPRQSHKAPETPALAKPSTPVVSTTTPTPVPRPQKADIPTELEFSDEDLALFPSFAANDQPGPPAEKAPPSPPAEIETPPPPVVEEPPPPPSPPLSPEARLARAAEALQSAEIRDDIADALLEFSRPHFARCMLLTLRGDTIVGWRGEGGEVEPTAVRAIAIPKDQPSVFSGLLQGTAFWLGPLPPMTRNQELITALGAPPPTGCLILPIKVRGKIVAFLYGDSGGDPLGSVPMADFKRLMAKTDIAFQVYLLKGKIRVI
ncbi:MAG: hypothetical protein ABFS37_11475 [Acidobacteriota bacterium]